MEQAPTQTIQAPTIMRPLKRKNPVVVVLLQCIPLLGASGCASMGITDQRSSGAAFLLWFSVLFWGLGYRYLGRILRFLTVFLIGPVFALTSCTYSVGGVSFDFEHGGGNVSASNAAFFQEALLIAAAVLLLTVDALRLTAAHNAKLMGGE